MSLQKVPRQRPDFDHLCRRTPQVWNGGMDPAAVSEIWEELELVQESRVNFAECLTSQFKNQFFSLTV